MKLAHKLPSSNWTQASFAFVVLLNILLTFARAELLDASIDNENFKDDNTNDDHRVESFVGFPSQLQCVRNLADGQIICDCGNRKEQMTLQPVREFGEHIHIRNCIDLHIPTASFAQASSLRSLLLSNIGTLTLEQGSIRTAQRPAFQPRGISVTFRHVNIARLASHSLQGNIEQLLFDGCRLDDVHSFAISPTHDMLSLTVQHSNFGQLARHVLKKFTVSQLSLLNCTFEQQVPSGWMYDVSVTERMRIDGSRFVEVLPNAFQLDTVRSFELTNNAIQTLNGSSFHMTVANRMVVMGNNITELSGTTFAAITSTFIRRPQANLQFQPPDFLITDNRIANADPLALRLRFVDAAFSVQLSQFVLLTPITCDDLLRPEFEHGNEFYRRHADGIYLRTCADCELLSYTHWREHRCVADRTIAYVAAGVGVMLVLLVMTILAVWWLYRRRQAALQRMTVVQPEARTYRETQIVIQIENAGLLKTDL